MVRRPGFTIASSLTDFGILLTDTSDAQWLFDHCRCPGCFHPLTKQRLKSLSSFSAVPHVHSMTYTDRGISIVWDQDGHETHLPAAFLRRASYNPPMTTASQPEDRRILWNSRIASDLPTVQYQSVMSDVVGEEQAERHILTCLDQVHRYGFCLIRAIPVSPQATEAVIRRISRIRETHYGGFWDFTANMSHGDLAYSTESLPAHTDTTYFTDPAGLQIFHLLSHPMPPGSGGTTLLVDGFHTANTLRGIDPAAYATLSRLRVPHHASGTTGTLLRPLVNQPVLKHDEVGQLLQVRWNNEDRGIISGSRWSAQDVKEWYAAARHFEALNQSAEAELRIQLRPGTMLIIDNWRVMHGRTSFTGSRRMCGAYVGADDWRSRRAALQKRFTPTRSLHVGDDLWDYGW